MAPDLALVMQYELQLRKRVAKLINEQGNTLVEAFAAVRKDGELRSRYFSEPLALSTVFAAATLLSNRSRASGANAVPLGGSRPQSGNKRGRESGSVGGRR
eukprot:59260-Amphidinium_carterae.1